MTYPAPQHLQPAPRRRPTALIVVIAVATLVVAAGTGVAAYLTFFQEDSGVAACRNMAESQANPAASDGSEVEITEEEYREVRSMFADSKHEQLREHGTALIDILWELSKIDDEDGMATLAFLGPLSTHTMGLKTACANEGIFVDLELE